MIVLCPTCHTKIDDNPQDYPIAKLHEWKSDHEHWVRERTTDELTTFSFSELEVVCRAMASDSRHRSDELKVIPPDEKMRRNNLTDSIRPFLAMGLSRRHEVNDFLSDLQEIDEDFPARLTAGFVEEYQELRREGVSGDDLFKALAWHPGQSFEQGAAQLAVLSYLFELCEVFES